MNKKFKYLIIVFLIVASFIAFGRIGANDFISFDDDQYVTENNHIKSGINLESIKWAFTSSHAANWHPCQCFRTSFGQFASAYWLRFASISFFK
jgi:hypothetical protein